MGRGLSEFEDSELLNVKPERVSVGIQARGFGWGDVVGLEDLGTLQLPWLPNSLPHPPEWCSSTCLLIKASRMTHYEPHLWGKSS